MNETETRIIEVQIDNEKAIKSLSEYNKKLQEAKEYEQTLKKQLEELQEARVKDVDKINKTKEALIACKEIQKEYSRTTTELSRAIQDQLKIENEQIKKQAEETGSLKDLRAELSRATKEYDSLTKAEREGAKGNELRKHINDITNTLKEHEEATQRYYRNVGNYKSALQQTGQAFSMAGVNANVFNKALNVLNANPFVKIVTIIVGVLAAVVKSFKNNEEASMRLKEALAPLQPIIDAIKRGFEAFAGILVTVVKGAIEGITQAVGWMLQKLQDLGNWFGADWHFADRFKEMQKEATDAYLKLAMLENAYVKKKRKWVTESAKLDREIADLREKASDKEKYTAEERLKYLDRAIALETQKAEQEKKLAEMNLKILQEKSKRTANSAEENDKLAEAERKVIEADTNLSNVKRNLNKQRQAAVDAIKAEAAAAEKEAEDYQKLVIQETQKAEDALNNLIKDAIEKRTKIENTRYERSKQELQAKMDAEKAAHSEETELYKAYAQQMEALETEHTNKMQEISVEAAQKQAEQRALEWQNRINEAKVKGEDYLKLELEQLEERLNTLYQYEEEADAEFKARQLEAQEAYLEKKKEMADAEMQIEKSKFQATAKFANQLSGILEQMGEDNKEAVQLAKVLGLAEVAINQGVAISEAVSSATAGDPYTVALRIASAVAAVVASFVSAFQSINSAKFAKGTSFVQGPGTETSDSIPAMLSKGEGVVTAKANRKYPGLVQYMNDTAEGLYNPLYSALRVQPNVGSQYSSTYYQNTYTQTASSPDLEAFAQVLGLEMAKLNISVGVDEIQRVSKKYAQVKELSKVN
jgi:myosin heavy subunit